MPAKRPRRAKSPRRSRGEYRPRVIVKFRDHIQLRHEQSAAREIEQRGIGPWQRLASEFKGITMSRSLRRKKRGDILGLVRRAAAADPTYRPRDLSTYYVVKVPVGIDPQALAKALSSWASVLFAYLEPPPVEPPAVNPADDPRSPNQGYLDPAPDGIDAEYAWGFSGGDGAGQSLWIWNGVGRSTTKISRPTALPLSPASTTRTFSTARACWANWARWITRWGALGLFPRWALSVA